MSLPPVITRLTIALAERYRVERELGAGGMATVYLAHDLRHERDVAIKVLRHELAEALGAERFLHEIKTTANLRHPHILPLYDSGEADGMLFYVMPLVEGETLRDRLTRERQLPLGVALRIAEEVSDALSYAHARGIVHRDIKPENILLEGSHAVVADFGIARAVTAAGGDRLTQTGMSVGTPLYMSPEQAAGESDIDGRSDLYSLACVLYEMLGGQAPFTGPTAAAIIRQHITIDAPPITNLRPAVPAHVAGALQRALAKSPVDRFNPVAQFSTALQSAVSADAPDTRAIGTSRTIAPHANAPSRRRHAIGIGIVVLLIATVAGIWFASPRTARAVVNNGIAVLPFSDLSADRTGAYLGDGIAETLISALTNVSGLTVAARTSSFAFRERGSTVREIGSALGVGTVLGGSVQRSGDHLRITADLVKAADGVTLWSQTFDRPAADIFAVQDEVVRAVIAVLQGRIVAASSTLGADAGTNDREAYDLYLQGLYFWNRRSLADFVQATSLYERAIARDSTFARPWSGLANTLITQVFVDTVNTVSTLTRARTAAETAHRLSPNLADAHVSLAYLLFLLDWDYAAADSAFRSVIERYPRNALGHKWYADVLYVQERADEAWHELRQTIALEPRSAITMYNIGAMHYAHQEMDSAKSWLDRGLDAAPGLVLALRRMTMLYALRADSAAYFDMYQRYQRASSRAVGDIPQLRRAWGTGGIAAVRRAELATPSSRLVPVDRALWRAALGDVDGAFRELDVAITQHDVYAPFIVVDIEFDVLRKDARWTEVRRRLRQPASLADSAPVNALVPTR